MTFEISITFRSFSRLLCFRNSTKVWTKPTRVRLYGKKEVRTNYFYVEFVLKESLRKEVRDFLLNRSEEV